MDFADAGRRRTQAWLGPPPSPPPAEPPRGLRWIASPEPTTPPRRVPNRIDQIIGDRYRLVSQIGEPQSNGIEIWNAHQGELDRPVTIEFLTGPSSTAEQLIEDARVVARIRHPHVIEYIDFGQQTEGSRSIPYLVSERLVGQTLAQLITRRGPVAWARTVSIVQQIGEALGAAHQHGIVHADLRTANVVLIESASGSSSGAEFVKLIGWGPARANYSATTMSPEQCRGESLDPRSDVYSLGCLLFTMITGDPPFVGEPELVAWQQQFEPAKTLREKAPRQFIPDEFERVVARCLAKSPEQRFANMAELGAAMAQLAIVAQAATSHVAPDPNASSSRPMGYANRPAPRSPRELSDSYAPVPVAKVAAPRPVAVPATDSAPSTVAVVVATLLAVAAVFGFGFGMYALVQHLISGPTGRDDVSSTKPTVEVSEDREPSATAPMPASSPGSNAGSNAVEGPIAVSPPTPQSTNVDGSVTPASTSEAASRAASGKPSKSKPSKSEPAVKPEPTPEPAKGEPEPKPEPKPEPTKDDKPSVKPDSKAKDKVEFDELLDPWG